MSVELENMDLDAIKEKSEEAPDIQVGMQVLQDGAKSSQDSVMLPTGYLDEEGVLHRHAEIREMTGEEEDILSSRKMSTHAKLNKVIENCTIAVGPYEQSSLKWKSIMKSLTVTDRLYLIIQARIASLGPLFTLKMRCSNSDCREYSTQTVDLNEYKISGLKNPMKRTWEGVLPRSKKKYVARVLTGWEEAKNSEASNKGKDLMSLALMNRLIELDGSTNITLAQLKKLGMADRNYFRNQIEKFEGEVDTSFEYDCNSCGQKNKENVDIATPSFFFPSET